MKLKWQKVFAVLLAILLLVPAGWVAPVAAATSTTVYHETFKDPTNVPKQSGGPTIEHVNKLFDGNEDDGALHLTNRKETWDGLDFNFADIHLQNGITYKITIKGYVDSDVIVPHDAVASLQPVNASTNSYGDWITSSALTAGQPFTLSADYTANATTYATLRIGSNEAGAEVPFYIGDVLITTEDDSTPPPTSGEFVLHDFEDGELGDWVRRSGEGNIAVTSDDNHTEDGEYSLETTGNEQYDGALLSVAGKLQKGHQYRLSAWVKMAEGQANTELRLSVQNGSSYSNVSPNGTVTDDNWVLLTGLYTQSTTPGDVLNAYVEIAEDYKEPRTFLLDDFKLTYNQAVEGPNPDDSLSSIHEMYKDYFPIGNIMNPGDFNDEQKLNFLKKHYVLMSAENNMKPDYAYNGRDFNFTNMDELVNNALNNEFLVHGHVLVWHSQSPEWLHTNNGQPLPRNEALTNLKKHIRTVVEHYGEKVISWDVVNEAVEDSLLNNPTEWQTTLRNSGWLRAIGPDFIYESFKAAREAIDDNGWDIDLYYNDYNDDNQAKATAIASMVKELNDKYFSETGKKLIDGIGMQSHYNLNTNPDNVRASIERFRDIGVKVGVTELDVTAGSNGAQTEEQMKAQAYLYAELFQIYKNYKETITRVTFWGVDDGSSWRNENSPLLFDSRYQAKPAYYAVIDPDKYINENPPVEKDILQSTAVYGKPVMDGMEDDVWRKAPVLPLNRYQSAHNGATGVAKALWDEDNLYVLIETNDTELDDTAIAAHEQDSVEVFLDENNAKSTSYQADDAQYRVNFKNIATFNPGSAEEGFESFTVTGDTYYRVELKIPFKTIDPVNNTKIGFDAQVNDASDGARQSAAIWNDLTGAGWQDPSVFGILTLTGKPDSSSPSDPSPYVPGPAPVHVPTTPAPDNKPVLTVKDGQAKVKVTANYLNQAFEKALIGPNGKKQIVIEVKAQEGNVSSAVEFPASSLNRNEAFVLTLKTPQGTIDIPSNMFSTLAGVDGKNITISIASANEDELDTAVREQIGNRPVIQLNVLVDGNMITWNNPNAPVTIAIPYAPTAAERANPDQILIWYIDGDGHANAVPNSRYDAANGVVRFHTTHFSKYAVAYVLKSFNDLGNIPWAKQAIEVMASRDVIKGVGNNSYKPSETIKKADFITMLVHALELQSTGEAGLMFSDVKSTDYFYNEVRIAKELGIATGTGNNQFNPHGIITRQEAMVFAAKAIAAAGIELTKGSLVAYSDADQVADYAKESVSALIHANIVNGMSGKITPKESLTRAQAAVILYRIWNY